MSVPFIFFRSFMIFAALAAALGVVPAEAQDFRVRAAPEVVVPLAYRDTFGLGGGGSLQLDTDFFGFAAPYAALDMRYIRPAASGVDGSLLLSSAGAGIGFFAFPHPRIKAAFSAGPGVYVGSYSGDAEKTMTGNIFWRAGAELGYRVSPGLTISAAVSYIDYRTRDGSFYKGIAASIMADIGLRPDSAMGRAVLQSAESEPVYPIRARDYTGAGFGSAEIRNAESAEIRNVDVTFAAGTYTSGPVLCGRIPYLAKGSSARVPLFAAFSDQVMTVTETVRVRGELTISYDLLGERRTSKGETTITVLHRNALRWEDPRILASFISPNDPAVLDSSKYAAGIVRAKAKSEIDANLQYGLGLFEGLRLAGIAWSADPQTPYGPTHGSADEIDYTQYPHQTIAYRSGDTDDLAALYASALESVGVPAAVIPLDGEVLAAFKMSSDEQTVRAAFSSSGDFLFADDAAWVPLRMSLLREGFLRAWSEGAAAARNDPGAREKFFTAADAWKRFPPAGVPGVMPAVRKPAEEQVRTAFESVLSLLVSREVVPRADRMRASFDPGGGTGRQRNGLGILYARYGMYREALAEFRAAFDLGETKAGINIGNVAFLTGDFKTAAQWYEKAVIDLPDRVEPVIGLARAYYELDRYDEADELFRRAVRMKPDLAVRYGYLSARLPGATARASAAEARLGNVMWND